MKKKYETPRIQVVVLPAATSLLAGSPIYDANGAGYGDAENGA